MYSSHTGAHLCWHRSSGTLDAPALSTITGTGVCVPRRSPDLPGHPLIRLDSHYRLGGQHCTANESRNREGAYSRTDSSAACLPSVQHSLQVVGTLGAHTGSVESVGFCDVLPYAATASLDGQLILWDVQSLSTRHTCKHDAPVVKVKWVPDSGNLFRRVVVQTDFLICFDLQVPALQCR